MKKATFFACACALLMGQSLMAQEPAQEVTYVEDASQGLLLNKFNNNWFITVDGGAGIYFSKFDQHRKTTDRFAPAADIFVGKWFSPIVGLRLGASWMQNKGLANGPVIGALQNEYMPDGYYKTVYNQVGPGFDAMVNLTNWWCKYNPTRVYNAIFYAGAGVNWTLVKDYKANGEADGWKNGKDTNLFGRVGLINSFRLSSRVNLFLDVRYTIFDGHDDDVNMPLDKLNGSLNAYLGLTFNLGKTKWAAPVVPVCPPAENCDALRARLSAAEARVADLERQLQDCLNRPVEKAACPKMPLATIYYPINKSSLSTREVNVLRAVASVMKESGKNYTLTGWADNYTGTESYNDRLRHARVNGVQRQLVRFGVAESQLNATVNNGNLTDLGEKAVQLDRAVTIEEAE